MLLKNDFSFRRIDGAVSEVSPVSGKFAPGANGENYVHAPLPIGYMGVYRVRISQDHHDQKSPRRIDSAGKQLSPVEKIFFGV